MFWWSNFRNRICEKIMLDISIIPDMLTGTPEEHSALPFTTGLPEIFIAKAKLPDDCSVSKR